MNLSKSRPFHIASLLIVIIILAGLGSSLLKFKNSIQDIQKNVGTTPHEIRYQLHQSISQVALIEQEMWLRKRYSLPYNSRSMINRTEQLKYRIVNIRGTWGALDTNLDKSHLWKEIDEFEKQTLALETLLRSPFDDELEYTRQLSYQVLKLKIVNAEMFSQGSKFLRHHTENYVTKLSNVATAINVLIVVFILFLGVLSYFLLLIFKQRNKLNRLSKEDPLTQLYNRRQFNVHLRQAVERYNRTRTPVTLIVFDVDFFKMFNDSMGHVAGDKALQVISKRLASFNKEISGLDSYRVGGEEFACIYSGLEYEDGQTLAETIRTAIEDLSIPHKLSTISDNITVSVGVAHSSQFDVATMDSLYSAADQALYQAKEHGRNQSCQFKTD
ncbi:GGDEF domain-containing protein [Marinomonas balearica]|uniref:diguanylate cyclase n=1 Tax=Marinomonas balearica TaxID=491947 RepID=A0A4R6M368_9GAMM|nr:GGDEF domain-containing protein [Marinomonas balearica]TDO95728.1 diguanylate cyclase (GGDEF)-like protein [Marinomonas balearica]